MWSPIDHPDPGPVPPAETDDHREEMRPSPGKWPEPGPANNVTEAEVAGDDGRDEMWPPPGEPDDTRPSAARNGVSDADIPDEGAEACSSGEPKEERPAPVAVDRVSEAQVHGAGPTPPPPWTEPDANRPWPRPDQGHPPPDAPRAGAFPASAGPTGAFHASAGPTDAGPVAPGRLAGVAARPAPSFPAFHPPAKASAGGPAPAPAVTGPERWSAPTPVARSLPRFMAVANQKGGVGKTTTAVNLGAALAEMGYRVLVIDLDPQGNATTGLGINARNLATSVYDVLLNDLALEDCIEPTTVRNLFMAPATIDLAGAEIELVPAFSRELRLRRALERLGDEYDFTLIDCPPSLGLLTVNGLAAASEVVVPIQCEYYALEGLGQLLRNVQLVQRNLNPALDLGAIILTMYDARTKLSDQVAKDVRRHFGPKVCRNIVPRTIRLSEAPSFGQPIIVFDPTSRGAIAYRELAKEVSGGAPRRTG